MLFAAAFEPPPSAHEASVCQAMLPVSPASFRVVWCAGTAANRNQIEGATIARSCRDAT